MSEYTETFLAGVADEEGDPRRVEIDDIGNQGDGITRVERGFSE